MVGILNLFEPKLPPINLNVISPAYWFYRNKVSQKPLIWSVASSTAIETGQSIERILNGRNGRFEGLKLADPVN